MRHDRHGQAERRSAIWLDDHTLLVEA